MNAVSVQMPTPVGIITVTADDTFIRSISLAPAAKKSEACSDAHSVPLIAEAISQLTEYFAGKRKIFKLPLDFLQEQLPQKERPSPFRRAVWRTLCTIPYGETWSYADVADAIAQTHDVPFPARDDGSSFCDQCAWHGSETSRFNFTVSPRAVGGANHANPFLIVVPCHRVINADGTLGGYACGSAAKKFLLDLESAHTAQ